jgi:FkbM family methyltransferase
VSANSLLRGAGRRLARPLGKAIDRRRVRVLGPDESPFMKPSFSQCGEDLIVRHLFDDLKIPTPTYLDIGAHHPFFLSNTALLHLSGSRGITVEPDPSLFSAFQEHRPDAKNLNIGVASAAGELTFYRLSAPGLSSFSSEFVEAVVRESGGEVTVVETSLINVVTVRSILQQHFAGACPDFLSLDVEGLDVAIIHSMEEWPALPIVICVETATFSLSGDGQKVPEIAERLQALGYQVYADTWVNTIFVRTDRYVGR